MKKINIIILFVMSILISFSNVYANSLNNGKSGYWSDDYAKQGYSHIGHFRKELSNITEGVMSYKRSIIYDYEITDKVYVSYVTTLYPEIKSNNYNMGVAIETIKSSYITTPTTSGFQFSFGVINSGIDIDEMNMGIGIKRTYSEILIESEINTISYKLAPNSNFLKKFVSQNEKFSPNNGTVAVYAKTVRIREHMTNIRQTGPIWNVYWTTTGYNVIEYDMLLDLSIFPITYHYKDSDWINNGQFFLNQLDSTLLGDYIAI